MQDIIPESFYNVLVLTFNNPPDLITGKQKVPFTAFSDSDRFVIINSKGKRRSWVLMGKSDPSREPLEGLACRRGNFRTQCLIGGLANPGDLLEQKQARVHTSARFRPTVDRLSDIADNGQKLLQNASDKDLTDFTE